MEAPDKAKVNTKPPALPLLFLSSEVFQAFVKQEKNVSLWVKIH